ncbi:MAG: NUDIX hydrolase [Pyrinomonadaceae bacterium]|nr:NUDIX hydrolase [Pyrinomonadaceae bacterium]
MNTSGEKLPEVLSSEDVYAGRTFSVSVDTVRETGARYKREIVHHPGSGCVVALFDDDTVALVRQYRHAARKYLLEIPAGSRRNTEESPEDCAHRELEEELGVTAGSLELLAEFYPSPGFCAEKMWVYLASELTQTQQNLDEDEFIDIVRIPFQEARVMIARGEIEDAKTIIGITLASSRSNRRT